MERRWHDEKDPRLPICYTEELLETLLHRKQNVLLPLCEEQPTIFCTTNIFLEKILLLSTCRKPCPGDLVRPQRHEIGVQFLARAVPHNI